MSTFAELTQIADDDVCVILGSGKKTNDLLIDHNPEVKNFGEYLDDIENRNATTIQLQADTDIATESHDLTPHEFQILKRSLKALTRQDILKTPALESGEKVNHRQIALEGIKETLKKFWNYVKSMLVEFWHMLKRWWIRTFDIAKRTKSRAQSVLDKADKEYGALTENEIHFPEIKRLAINGKTNDIPLIVRGLKDLEDLTFEFIDTHTSEKFNDTIENLSDQVNRILGRLKQDAEEIKTTVGAGDDSYRVRRSDMYLSSTDLKPLNDAIGTVFASNDSDLVSLQSGFNFPNIDKYKKQYGEFTDNMKTDLFNHSAYLPGDKWLLSVQPKDLLIGLFNTGSVQANDAVDYIRRSRIVLADCMYAPKTYDVDSTVKVMQPTSISRGCESIIAICGYVNEYRLAFERREKFKDRVIKEIDQAINDSTSDDGTTYGEVDRLIRSFANAITGLIRRRSDFETNFCAYAVSTSVCFLNYSELSLKQFTS